MLLLISFGPVKQVLTSNQHSPAYGGNDGNSMFNREHSNPKEEDTPSRCKWNRQVSEKSQEARHVATSKDVEHGLHMLIFQPLKA